MADICRLRLGRDGQSRAVRDICAASQGWVAGLVLMLEQYRSGHYCPTAQRGDSQTHLDLFNYFAAEVFASLPIERQGFLMRTALFPSLNGKMAEALTGHAAADQVLETLAEGNFFTTRRVRDNIEYEYHPLFRTFLLSRLEQALQDNALQRLYRRAADILVAHHHWHEAAELYCQVADWEALAALCEQGAPHLLEIGSTQALLRHLHRIPGTVLENKPWLLLYYGAAAMHSDSAFEWIRKQGTDALPASTQERMTMAIFTALMYRQPAHSDLPLWAARLEEIVEAGQDDRLCMKAGIHLLMYHAWWSGDLPRIRWLVETLRRCHGLSGLDPMSRITWHAIEAAYSWLVGEPDVAIECMHTGLRIANEHDLHALDFMLCAQGAWAHLTGEDLVEAGKLLMDMEGMLASLRGLDVCHFYYLKSMLSLHEEDMWIAVGNTSTVPWLWDGTTTVASPSGTPCWRWQSWNWTWAIRKPESNPSGKPLLGAGDTG